MSNNEENKKDPLLLDHDYDGIQELDHPLPSYWVNGFLMTIVFALLYSMYYWVLHGKSLNEEYQVELKNHEAKMLAQKLPESPFQVEKLNGYLASPHELNEGEKIFVDNCVACHKEKGIGDIGPNLTDEFWINGDGNKPEFLFDMVMNGKEDMGMPPWKEILTEDEVYHVIAYVKNLKGIKLPGAKAAQGNKYE